MLEKYLDKVVTVQFNKIVGSNKVIDLFRHICQETGCQISYDEVNKVFMKVKEDKERFKKYTAKIMGSMKSPEIPMVKFSLLVQANGFGALQFSTRGAYKLYQIDPKELEFMNKVKESIERYLSRDLTK